MFGLASVDIGTDRLVFHYLANLIDFFQNSIEIVHLVFSRGGIYTLKFGMKLSICIIE